MEVDFPLALTFDDVLLVPGYAGFLRSDIDITSHLTKRIKLRSPLVSAPMDTVTESRLAIALGQEGGIGIIHRNLSVDSQAHEVAKVKAADLLVGAAVGSKHGFEKRVEVLVKAGADVLVVDSAHGYSKSVIEAIKLIKKEYRDVEVIAGNIATSDGARALIQAGADGIRVGMGPGAICSTRVISGMGVPQLTALIETVKVARSAGVPVIADGGINYSGDLVKALAAGASTVMMGSLFAATTESAGETVELPPDQVPGRFRSILNGHQLYTFKQYRGMGSVGAMQKGAAVASEDEFHGKSYQNDQLVAEGVEGLVPLSGDLAKMVIQYLGGLRSGMFYIGAESIPELWRKARFMRITQASLAESHPHDLLITNPGANYLPH